MNRASIQGGGSNQIKLAIQTDQSKPFQLSQVQSKNISNQKMRLPQATNSGVNTPQPNQNYNLLGNQSVKNLRIGSLLSPTSQISTQSPYTNSGLRKSQQLENNAGLLNTGTAQFGGQKNEIYQIKKDSLQRPSTAAAAAASLVGKTINRKTKGSVVNSYLQTFSPDMNQDNLEQVQMENQQIEQDGDKLRNKRPQTAVSRLLSVQSLITAEYQTDLEQKMYFLQYAKDKLNSAFTGLQTDDKNKLFEITEPPKQEVKLEYGVYSKQDFNQTSFCFSFKSSNQNTFDQFIVPNEQI